MSDKPNNPFQFWQELKRRKVIRVIPVYAAASFVLLELVDIIADPFGLPDWTLKFVVVLLSIGFIISIILSWIYDVTPEGVKKTKPISKVTEQQKETGSKMIGWKITSCISVVIIIGLLLVNIFGIRKQAEVDTTLEKSIAVLPFINDSPDDENMYFINGIMEEVLINLQTIKDIRVPGRTSVEQYRNQTKSISEIANELDVDYIVEGSGQRYGNMIRLRVQLLEGAKDKHIWAESYEQELRKPEDIFKIQSQIAQTIAAKLEAIISPEEKQRIEKVPTSSLIAYDFYQRAREEHVVYQIGFQTRKVLTNVEDLYHKALEYDTTFARAYVGLAQVYWDKHYWEIYFSEESLDSVLILADIALSYDDQLAEAYTVKGEYYREKGSIGQAIEEYDKALKINSNNWLAYFGKGRLYFDVDNIKSIDYFQKAISVTHGSELPALLRWIGFNYMVMDCVEKGNQYIQKALKLDGDSMQYYLYLGRGKSIAGKYEKANEYLKKGYSIDTTHINNLSALGLNYFFLGQYAESLKYYKKLVEKSMATGNLDINYMHRIGYAYWRNGYKEEAEYYFDKQINYCKRANELGRPYSQMLYTYYDLAGVYAFRGEKEKSFENLRIFNQKQFIQFMIVTLIKNDPLFDSIRDEPEFQQIVRDLEAKYQAEHERVRKWLEEQEML